MSQSAVNRLRVPNRELSDRAQAIQDQVSQSAVNRLRVPNAVAEYSDKYHEQLKESQSAVNRLRVPNRLS